MGAWDEWVNDCTNARIAARDAAYARLSPDEKQKQREDLAIWAGEMLRGLGWREDARSIDHSQQEQERSMVGELYDFLPPQEAGKVRREIEQTLAQIDRENPDPVDAWYERGIYMDEVRWCEGQARLEAQRELDQESPAPQQEQER